MSHPATADHSPDDASGALRTSTSGMHGNDPMVGRVIAGRFTVLSRLGEGAMGTVYRAKQSPIGREVAVKILRSERALDETSRGRFLREARANSLLTSPNTVTVFDFGTGDSGEFYLAMELLEGESLGQRLKRVGRLDVASALDTARQALRSLAEAHAKGIIHRDLKPDNLFFARVRTNETFEEIVKVLDFGIAKMLRADDEAIDAIETQAGTVFGTPRYMSPEQAQGKPLDARSDLYSLGVILYQMLTGRCPFTDDDAIVVMARHIKTMPRPMSEVAPDAQIPPEVENAVMRVLSKDPASRPQSAEAMSMELSRARESALTATSGIRASLAAAVEGRHSVRPAPVANDTFDALREMKGPSRAGRAAVVLLALGAAIVGAGTWMAMRTHTRQAIERPESSASAQVASATSPAAVVPAVAVHTAAAAPTAVATAPAVVATASPARPVEPRAPASSPARTNAVSSGEGRTAAPARRHATPRPAPSAEPAGSVGYGYLE